MRACKLVLNVFILFIVSVKCTVKSQTNEPPITDVLNLDNSGSNVLLHESTSTRRILFNPPYSVAVVRNVGSKFTKDHNSDLKSEAQPKSLHDSRTSGLSVTDNTRKDNDLDVPPSTEQFYNETKLIQKPSAQNISSLPSNFSKIEANDAFSTTPSSKSNNLSNHRFASDFVSFEPTSTVSPTTETSDSAAIQTPPNELSSSSAHTLNDTISPATEKNLVSPPLSIEEERLSSTTLSDATVDTLKQPSPTTILNDEDTSSKSEDYQLLVTEILSPEQYEFFQHIKANSTASSTPPSVSSSTNKYESTASINNTSHQHSNETQINIRNKIPPVKIRKCCEESEFFSLLTVQCEPTENTTIFYELTNKILHESAVGDISLSSSTLKCPGNEGPKTTPGVSNSTHVVIDSGVVYEVSSGQVYNHSEYCFELVGREFSTSLLTIAYCEKTLPEYYYDYPDSLDENLYAEEVLDTYDLTVRKCCQEFEYYNSQLHKCEKLDDADIFHNAVKQMSFGSENVGLNIISSRLRNCPNQVDLPVIQTLDNNIFRLRYNGDIIDTSTGLQYDYSYYCMEYIGLSPETMILNIALCNKANYMLPKCCPHSHYFDEDELDCLPIPKAHLFGKNLLHEYKLDNYTYALEELTYFLPCQNALPAKESADNFVFRDGHLCLQETCYNRKDFCVDYVGDASAQELKPIAYYCRKNYFVKCCDQNQILHEDGCANYEEGKSLLLKQLTRTRSIVRSFNYKECQYERALLLEDGFTKYIQWWLGDSGTHLIVESSTEVKELQNYCIDDFKDTSGKVSPSAYVCESEVEHMIPIEKTQRIFQKKGSLGKCCPKSTDPNFIYYYSSLHGDCEITSTNNSLKLLQYFNQTIYKEEHFHDFPKCSNSGVGYHAYPLTPGNFDHAQPTDDGMLKIISMAGKCVEQEELITDRDFCFEYIMNSNGILEPSAVVCAHTSVLVIYNEKFSLVTALLGISCICLFATLISLCTVRVRRGLVSTRKINTLAGRILVSFVGSHLIGYLSLALMQHDNSLNKETSPGCYILAACIQFFNLATFCWNTSICLESLLLTIHISISELLRYCLHSIWAWGFPGLMTLLMLLMDAYKDQLPCGTITPDIGVQNCFHSDTEARLLYFYVPIFITLTCNVMFLVGAKALRNSRLRRLEKGKPKTSNGSTENNGNTIQSGMRTHQSQNTKVESLRLVLWTGGTWFLELAGFIVTKYLLPHRQERWFDYLWYIPTSVNALRGVGIFAIIVLTPETRTKISNATANFRDTVSSRMRRTTNSSTVKTYPNGNQPKYTDTRRRNLSITTMISNISYFRNSSLTGKTRNTKLDDSASSVRGSQSMVRSVSQNGRKSSISSAASGDLEEYNMDKGRKCSIPMNNMVLPKLHEEDYHKEMEDSRDMSSCSNV